jgi:type IV pilus assembly protein PilW
VNRQHGLSLAELMVALTVGLLVLLFGAVLLLSANRAYLSQNQRASVDDNGRYAIDIITRAARQASFVNFDSGEIGVGGNPTAAAGLVGLDNSTLERKTDGIADPRSDAVNGSDILAVRFVGAGAGPDGDGSVISCAGFAVNAFEQGWSIFYVARNADGDAELRCKYRGKSGWGADAVVSGVDTFQLLYGVDTDEPPDGVANEFITATALDARDAALVLAGDDAAARARDLRRRTYWKRVASIRVALLLHGPPRADHADRGENAMLYDLFGKPYSDVFLRRDPGVRLNEADLPLPMRQRERKLFTATILLRNPGL